MSSGGNGVTFVPATSVPQGHQMMQQHYVGAPVVAQVARTANSRRADAYLSRQSMGLGVTLIVVGVLAIIFNGVGFAVSDTLAVVSHGFYCGGIFIITGSFGVAAATSKNKCVIITFMIMSIISAVFTVEMFIVGVVGAATNQCNTNNYGYSNCYSSYGYYYTGYCSAIYSYTPPCRSAAIAMEAVLASLAIVAAIASIWGSVICCKAVCCCGYTYGGMVLPAQYANYPVVIIGQQQMGANTFGGAQVVTGVSMPGQPPVQYWAAPPYQPPAQDAAVPAYDNVGLPATVAGSYVPPPAYGEMATASAPAAGQQYEKI